MLASSGLEIAVIAATLTVLWSVVWLWRRWSAAARGPGGGIWPSVGHDGQPRRAPGWTVVLLPATLALALTGLAFWKSPLWLPKLLARTALLYAAGVVALFVMVWIGVGRHASTNWEAMQLLRHWWDLLEIHLRYPARWHRTFHAIPHGRKKRIEDGDLFHAMWLLSVVGAPALVTLAVLLRTGLALLKRSLEALAR